MTIDFSAFEKAINQLEKSLSYVNSDMSKENKDLREQFRAAAIHAFEYTYELAIKMVRRQLAQIVANPAELKEMNFMELIRTAHQAGLVHEAPPYKIYREHRNSSSHTYNEEKAEEILVHLPSFLADSKFLLEKLKNKNHGSH